MGYLEDWCIGVLVDGYNGLRILDPRQVLDGSRNSHSYVQIGGHHLPCLAHLH